jgi:hypothetical protein
VWCGSVAKAVSEKPTLWNFIRAFREHWFAAISGCASVPFTALAAFLDATWAQLLFAGLALTGAGFAAYRVWKPERQRVCDLEARLTPRIGMDDGSVREYPTQRGPLKGPPSKWAQIKISAMTDAPLTDCETLLTRVDRIREDGTLEPIEVDPIFCFWADLAATRTTIAPDIPRWANLFSAYEHSSQLELQVTPQKVNLAREIQKPGTYRLCISVTAQDARASRMYRFHWGGSFQHMTLTPES